MLIHVYAVNDNKKESNLKACCVGIGESTAALLIKEWHWVLKQKKLQDNEQEPIQSNSTQDTNWKGTQTKDGIEYKTAQAESQEDSSFPVEGQHELSRLMTKPTK